ncbi:MAG: F0F1 ATP synthase subunit epsilon [Candidatus Aminicenantes bacterium]|nr:F0F1 ATP synthase subunit epsilon [Candidatus Aminicenantes bacterium]
MRLKVLIPAGVILDEEVSKVSAQAENGSFTLLPRHIDFVATLVQGILSYYSDDQEKFLAINEGILVKRSSEVTVSTRNAIIGDKLGELQQAVRDKFQKEDEQEKKARSALARLESDFIRRFMEIEKHGQ